mmetsp:Transcript_27340/g.88321  ORF Transcript_27340/g.88321 Transcript_27340/m.88321 type:complete len:210 (-) Transcript_27340:724-1353(-)
MSEIVVQMRGARAGCEDDLGVQHEPRRQFLLSFPYFRSHGPRLAVFPVALQLADLVPRVLDDVGAVRRPQPRLQARRARRRVPEARRVTNAQQKVLTLLLLLLLSGRSFEPLGDLFEQVVDGGVARRRGQDPRLSVAHEPRDRRRDGRRLTGARGAVDEAHRRPSADQRHGLTLRLVQRRRRQRVALLVVFFKKAFAAFAFFCFFFFRF